MRRTLSLLISIVITLFIVAALPVFAQDEPAPILGNVTVTTDNVGQAIINLTDIRNASHLQVWIGDDNQNLQHRQWYKLADKATCDAGNCTLPLDYFPEIGNYTVYVQPWGAGGYATVDPQGWYGPANFAVAVTPPQPSGDFSLIISELGQVQVILNDATHTEWVRVWVGHPDLNELYFEWHQLSEDAACNGQVCTLALDLYPGYGEYQAYIRPWGEMGYARNGRNGWFGPKSASITTPPPAPITSLNATATTLTWQYTPTAIWYQVWAGELNPRKDVIFRWYRASDLGCGSGGTCTLTLTGAFAYGSENQWYVRAFGRGGYSQWSQGPNFSIGVNEFALGGQVHYFNHPDRMRDAGLGWVKRQVVFELGKPLTEPQKFIDDAQREGFSLLLSILGHRDQLAADFDGFTAAYATYVGQVAALMPANSAIEVWNEPNLEREWPTNMISGSLYTQVLARAYTSIKAANPGIMVISAAPAPTGVSLPGQVTPDDVYLREMKNAGAAAYMDCVGVHYNEGVLPPTATSGDPRGNSNFHSRYYPAMVNLYASVFPTKPLCFTELGYLTAEDIGTLPSNFAWAQNTTLQQHANWLAQAAVLSRDDPRVRMMIIWNVDFNNWGVDPMVGWAMIRPNGHCPSCATLKPIFNP